MKRTHFKGRSFGEERPSHAMTPDSVRSAIAHLKQSLLHEYADLAGEHTRLLRLALNEAEAVAWQSGFPQLIFPVLAAEKAKTAVTWHERQRALRRGESERAFAE